MPIYSASLLFSRMYINTYTKRNSLDILYVENNNSDMEQYKLCRRYLLFLLFRVCCVVSNVNQENRNVKCYKIIIRRSNLWLTANKFAIGTFNLCPFRLTVSLTLIFYILTCVHVDKCRSPINYKRVTFSRLTPIKLHKSKLGAETDTFQLNSERAPPTCAVH